MSCAWCGGTLEGRSRKHCSYRCKDAMKEQRRRAHREQARLQKLEGSTPFECAECSELVEPRINYIRAKDGREWQAVSLASRYCSAACEKRVSQRRLGRPKAVLPWRRVAMRDGWRCQSCGRKTPEKARASFTKNAPEIDHIIPHSRGGTDDLRNLQLLCAECNRQKGNAGAGQLRLIG